ncbi:hypothetical protein HD806DRAFT_127692 [Xylariaceae sp. AK1471]|nr:hypothetical protein HD806DRAFT_127692 [Xylariaceae sp. AK1471]
MERSPDFASASDYMFRGPEFRSDPRPRIPPSPPDSLPTPHQDFNNLMPHHAAGSPGRMFSIPDEWDSSDESDEDYDGMSGETYSNPEKQDKNSNQQDFDPEDYSSNDLDSSSFLDSDSEIISEDSDSSSSDSSSSEEGHPRHHGTLKGTVGGIYCTFKSKSRSNCLNVTAPWFPYKQYPSAFRWSCCGAVFGEPVCRPPQTVTTPRLPFMHRLLASCGRRTSSSHGPDYDEDLESSGNLDEDPGEDAQSRRGNVPVSSHGQSQIPGIDGKWTRIF